MLAVRGSVVSGLRSAATKLSQTPLTMIRLWPVKRIEGPDGSHGLEGNGQQPPVFDRAEQN